MRDPPQQPRFGRGDTPACLGFGRGLPFAKNTLHGLLAEAAIAGAGALIERRLKETPAGLPAAERAARVAELESKILRLEREEEAAIRDAEVAGVVIERRPDADPAAVLGL